MGRARYGIIYKIENKINKKIYIGQTVKTFKQRYRNDLAKYTHNEELRKDILLYGIENFEITKELDIAKTKEELDEKERYYISLYDSFRNGYNETIGGDSLGSGKNNPNSRKVILLNFNKIFTSIVQASKKYNIAPQQISACCYDKRKSAGKFNNRKLVWMFYDDYLEATEEKIIDKIKLIEPRKIICLNDSKIYYSIKDCVNFYKISISNMYAHLRGYKNYSIIKGKKFMYLDDYEKIK